MTSRKKSISLQKLYPSDEEDNWQVADVVPREAELSKREKLRLRRQKDEEMKRKAEASAEKERKRKYKELRQKARKTGGDGDAKEEEADKMAASLAKHSAMDAKRSSSPKKASAPPMSKRKSPPKASSPKKAEPKKSEPKKAEPKPQPKKEEPKPAPKKEAKPEPVEQKAQSPDVVDPQSAKYPLAKQLLLKSSLVDWVDVDAPLPFFLAAENGEIDEVSGGGVLPSATRTYHQRKKDVKTLNAGRTAEKIEKEFVERWGELKFPSDKKKAKEASDAMAKMEVNWYEIHHDTCQQMLYMLDESWESRMQIVQHFVAQLMDPSISEELFYLKMSKFLYALGVQFTDPRSLVIGSMNESLASLSKAVPKRFILFAPYLMRQIYPNMAVRIEVLRDAAIECAQQIVNSCLDVDPPEYELFYEIMDGLTFKHSYTRTCCALFLIQFLKKLPKHFEQENMSETDSQFLQDVDTAVRRAVTAASAETRINGYKGLHIYKKIAPKRAAIIIDKMSKAVRIKFEGVARRGSMS